MKPYSTKIFGENVEYFRAGKGQKKAVFLHGWSAEINLESSFGPLVRELEQGGFLEKYEIILPYFAGFGGTKVADKKGYSTLEYEQWLEKFLEKLEISPDILLGHSFGGRVLCRRLMQGSSGAEAAFLLASAGIKWPLSARQKISIFLSQKMKRSKKFLSQKWQRFVLDRILGARDWGAVPDHLRPTLTKVLAEPDFREDLVKIKTKTVIFWGARDRITPLASGKVLAENIADSELVVFPDSGHAIHRTNAGEIAAKIQNFLREREKEPDSRKQK